MSRRLLTNGIRPPVGVGISLDVIDEVEEGGLFQWRDWQLLNNVEESLDVARDSLAFG